MSFVFLALVACTLAAYSGDPFFSDKELNGKLLSTSNVLKTGSLRDWWVTGYALPHEPMRRLLYIAKRVAKQSFKANVPWHRTNFFLFWSKFVVPYIHGHHMAEVKSIFCSELFFFFFFFPNINC
jgi:hypothetical protein